MRDRSPTAGRAATRINYADRMFAPVNSAGETPSLGYYHQNGDLVWAEFRSGTIRAGRLVGTVRSNGTIDAAYCLVSTRGETIAGTCVSEPTVLPDGRIRLTENWRRHDGSVGVSLIEELTP
jgi:hypothetical protein